MRKITAGIYILMIASCTLFSTKNNTSNIDTTVINDTAIIYADTSNPLYINTGNTAPEEIVSYAETLIGIPYLYASSDPQNGFDCSGFITYVFNHFNIVVPRSSVDFTDVPHEVAVTDAKPGDLILFTGTDSTIRTVGHMGIVIINNPSDTLRFIHSSSGKADGVTVTPLNNYYKGRFVKVIRVFPQNNIKPAAI